MEPIKTILEVRETLLLIKIKNLHKTFLHFGRNLMRALHMPSFGKLRMTVLILKAKCKKAKLLNIQTPKTQLPKTKRTHNYVNPFD